LSGGVEILYVDAAARDNLKAAAGLGFGHWHSRWNFGPAVEEGTWEAITPGCGGLVSWLDWGAPARCWLMNILWFCLRSRRKRAVHKTGRIRIEKSERCKRTCYDCHHFFFFGLFWCDSETHSNNGSFFSTRGQGNMYCEKRLL
jgi:hypothetical protein